MHRERLSGGGAEFRHGLPALWTRQRDGGFAAGLIQRGHGVADPQLRDGRRRQVEPQHAGGGRQGEHLAAERAHRAAGPALGQHVAGAGAEMEGLSGVVVGPGQRRPAIGDSEVGAGLDTAHDPKVGQGVARRWGDRLRRGVERGQFSAVPPQAQVGERAAGCLDPHVVTAARGHQQPEGALLAVPQRGVERAVGFGAGRQAGRRRGTG